jgi:hypothetical protein
MCIVIGPRRKQFFWTSWGKPHMNVGIADVFHTPTSPSFDVFIIVATRNTRLSTSNMKGKESHSQLIAMNVSLTNASPLSIVLLGFDRTTFVMAVAKRCICLVTLFGASQGLNSSKRLQAGPLCQVFHRKLGIVLFTLNV